MADVRILVTVDSAGAVRSVKNFDESIKDLQHQAPRTETALGSMWQQVAGGVIVSQAAMRAARLFTNELRSTVTAAMEQEKADRAMAAALEITGRGVDRNMERMKRFAAEQQKVTTYGDEQIQMVQTLLVQMTDLDQEGLERATKGTLGLSSALGMDLNAAALLVQKAMAGQFATLSRYGIVLDENLTAEEKKAALLDKLSALYGRAIADTETYEGKVKQLNNAWGDFKETLGKAYTQSNLVNGALESLTITLTALTDEAEKIPEKMSFWEKIAAALGPSYTSVVLGAAATTRKFSDETFLAEDAWRQMSNMVLNGRRTAIDPLPVILESVSVKMRKLTADTNNAKTAWDKMRAAALEQFITPEIFELQPESIVSQLFPPEEMVTVPPFLQGIVDGVIRAGNAAAAAASKTRTAWENAAQAIWMMDATFSQMETNRTIAIDNEYRARLNAINATMQDEEQRQQAIMALEAEYQIKRTEARRAGAKEQKAVSLMEAVIHTARAVTEALPNIPLSIIVAALGAAQIAAIAAQPIPLAEGATFERPTLIKDVLIGEKGKEHVLQERKLIDIVKQANADARDGGGGVFTISGGINIYTPALASGDVRRVGDEIWSEMEYQATRRGYSLRGRG